MTAEWDRIALAVTPDAEETVPLISSAFEESQVAVKRRAEYARVAGDEPDAGKLIAFHRSHENGPSAYSVCMHRPEAMTRSFTRVTVGAERITMVYHPGPPCETAESADASLARSAAAAGGSGGGRTS